MKRNIYFNWIVIIMIPLGNIISLIFGYLILFPAFNSPGWIIGGTVIITTLIVLILWSFLMPFILILSDDIATFIGFPWITRIKLEKIERIIIKTYSFAFIPKNKNDYKFVSTYKDGDYMGYKFISFRNLEAWGELIKFFKPINPGTDIRWKVLSEKEQRYIEEKLYYEN